MSIQTISWGYEQPVICSNFDSITCCRVELLRRAIARLLNSAGVVCSVVKRIHQIFQDSSGTEELVQQIGNDNSHGDLVS